MRRLIVLALALSVTLAPFFVTSTSAISGFNAGRIIDDSVFTNTTTMDTGQIQSFLNSKVPTCDTYGTKPSEFGGGTRAQWAQAKYGQSTFTCLKDYSENGKSAAQIIYDAAQQFSINPQVLIVLLQKEQGLVTDEWPVNIQYRSATGYGCPDSTPGVCDSSYYGFTNQVNWAARMYRAILNNSPTWYTPYVLGNNYIQYSPNSSCGGSTVNIQNRSTQALYNYTPYQPNQASLDAGYGDAPGDCDSHGNRNFYLYFTDWFGSTYQRFVSLDTPRWMVLSSASQKYNINTAASEDPAYAAGTQLRFVDKVWLNDTWYLRTAYDSTAGIDRGIPIASVADIAPVPLPIKKYMQLNSPRQKWNPASGIGDTSLTFSTGTQLEFASKITVNDVDYYRTAYDTQTNNSLYITASGLNDLAYTDFLTPRYFVTNKDTSYTDPPTGQTGTAVVSGTQLKFYKKLTLNGQDFFSTGTTNTTGQPTAMNASSLSPVPYTALSGGATWLELKRDTKKYFPSAEMALDNDALLKQGDQLQIVRQIIVNGKTYYQTAFDQQFNQDKAIPADDFQTISYTNMDVPRYLKLTQSTAKINPTTGATSGGAFPAGTRIYFSSKIVINGITYLRSQFDADNNIQLAIPIKYLVND